MPRRRSPSRPRPGPDGPLAPETAARLAGVFKTLADPTRLRLISAMLTTERCVHDLATILQLEQSTVSHQLRILRALRLVRRRKEGRHVFYALDDAHVSALFDFALEHIEHEQAPRGG